MLEWKKLLCSDRRKQRSERDYVPMETGAGRIAIERDYDRILFATPTRRMADKTQVFPLDPIDSVRTRLTHSHEVSNLCRSIGVQLAFDHPEAVFGAEYKELNVERVIPPLLAAIGLAHDLGNPPFGHQGEVAISSWFAKQAEEQPDFPKDFINFDGNAQTFRILTRLQILNDDFGLNLTDATLAALIKYPAFWVKLRGGFKKGGIFESERHIAHEIWKQTGLQEGMRHPLTYIMEACDDIAYSVLDAEDTIKKGLASFYDLINYLEHHSDNDTVVNLVIEKSKEKNIEYKNENLSSSELNDISTQMLRVKAIAEMVKAVTELFVEDCPKILKGEYGSQELIKNSKASKLCQILKDFDTEYAYKNKKVLRLELEGSIYIQKTMDMIWQAISEIDNEEKNRSLYANYVISKISENYQRIYDKSEKDDYAKAQLLSDYISGMTDGYLIKIHDELDSLYDKYNR